MSCASRAGLVPATTARARSSSPTISSRREAKRAPSSAVASATLAVRSGSSIRSAMSRAARSRPRASSAVSGPGEGVRFGHEDVEQLVVGQVDGRLGEGGAEAAQVSGGLDEGQGLALGRGRLQGPPHRPVRPVERNGGDEVPGQFGRRDRCRPCRPFLEGRSDRLVQCHPMRRIEAIEDRLPQQVVGEVVPVAGGRQYPGHDGVAGGDFDGRAGRCPGRGRPHPSGRPVPMTAATSSSAWVGPGSLAIRRSMASRTAAGIWSTVPSAWSVSRATSRTKNGWPPVRR